MGKLSPIWGSRLQKMGFAVLARSKEQVWGSGSGWTCGCSSGLFSNHLNWPMSGRQLQENPLLMRESQESRRGGVGGDRGLVPREAAQSEAQGHRPDQELLFLNSRPALRCSGAVGRSAKGLCARFLCAVSCQGACIGGPHALGGGGLPI